ncbi:MAG: PepSY domain-containing protein [Veillonella sp.]|uniref:PepSY domain-containing protein n=1 Tax=Veillonella sp. TaxID=1926307 RepID=UPI0025DB6410|nr:PepSY domain-containing protein [Veillonella sp.]MBS4913773.1 PepSY domain-containing protein [Veillonella sp.]
MKKLVKMLAVAAVVAGTFSLAQANGEITADQATAIALARVPGANASHVYKVHPDFEDGRKVYEGKIYFNGVEYEFEIDAATGQVTEWDVDR